MDNVNLVSHARNEIALDFDYEKLHDNLKLTDTHDYTFILPDLSLYADDFRWVLVINVLLLYYILPTTEIVNKYYNESCLWVIIHK